MYHGFCNRGGCHVDAKNGPNVTTIPRAQQTGRLKVVTEAHVTKIEVNDQGRVTGVTYVTGKEEFFQPAKVVLLSTYTYENSRLLLLSTSKAFPKGLANNHGQVGRHYFSHATGASVTALFPFNLNSWYGLPAQGVAVDDWADDNFDHGPLDFIGGGNLWVYSDRRPIAAANMNTFGKAPGWGKQWKAFVKENADRVNTAYLQKTTLPYEDNYLDLDPEVKDPLGFPVCRITADYKDNERKIADFIQEKMELWYRAAGAIDIVRGPLGTMGLNTHAYGGTRMGDSPDTNVVNRHGLCARGAESRRARRVGDGHQRRPQPDADRPGAGLADGRAPGQELEVDRASEHCLRVCHGDISRCGNFCRRGRISRRRAARPARRHRARR